MVAVLHAAQLSVSLLVIILFWLIYPGVMAIVATVPGLFYLTAALASMRGSRSAGWLAFAFSLISVVASGYGIARFSHSGFDFFAGNFGGYGGLYLPPYVFIAIFCGAVLAVGLRLTAWRGLFISHRPRNN